MFSSQPLSFSHVALSCGRGPLVDRVRQDNNGPSHFLTGSRIKYTPADDLSEIVLIKSRAHAVALEL